MTQSVDSALLPYLERIEEELHHLTPSPQYPPLQRPISYFFSLPGKRIRPLITLITAEHFSGAYESALPAAVAIELLHDFTLVHDDIMDEDQLRRGCQTVHTKWDIGTAILAGDAMVALAYKKLLQTQSQYLIKMIEAFTDGMYIVCEGQARDKAFETMDEVDIEDYLRMISQKTARLFSLAFELGYLCSKDDKKVLHGLKDMGEVFGLAFQVRDDLLDFIADEKTLGKDIGSDWRRKKKTYITIGYQHKVKKNPQFPPDLFALPDFVAAREAVQQAGILDNAQQFIQERLAQAKNIADAINFTHPVFNQLLQFLAERSY